MVDLKETSQQPFIPDKHLELAVLVLWSTKHSNFGFQPQNFRAQMVWIWRVCSMLSLSSMFLGWNVKHHFKWKREMESITMKTFFCCY